MLHLFFHNIRAFNNELVLEDRLSGFLPAEVSLSRTVKRALVHIFLNDMKLFGHDSGARQKSTEQRALNWQPRSIRRIKNFISTLATAIPLQLEVFDVALHATPENSVRRNRT